jgi:hypothetical protein
MKVHRSPQFLFDADAAPQSHRFLVSASIYAKLKRVTSYLRRILAAVAICAPILLSKNLSAQTQRDPPSAISSQQAALALPEAPLAQNTPPADPLSNPASSSSDPQLPASSAKAPITTQPSAEQIREQQREQADRDIQAERKQRLLGIMPQFQTVVGGKAVPLTPSQKWNLASHTAIDPFYIAYAFVVGGGYSEIDDSHQGYHWGAAGYLKRVGANYADNIDGALIGNGLLPILLHQDPRYFRMGTGSFGRRFLHAAVSTVVCRGDNGHKQANVSNVLGNFISGAISNAYYPADERGMALTLENGAEVTALGAVGGQLLEFGPDINRLLHHHQKTAPAAPAATGQQP